MNSAHMSSVISCFYILKYKINYFLSVSHKLSLQLFTFISLYFHKPDKILCLSWIVVIWGKLAVLKILESGVARDFVSLARLKWNIFYHTEAWIHAFVKRHLLSQILNSQRLPTLQYLPCPKSLQLEQNLAWQSYPLHIYEIIN